MKPQPVGDITDRLTASFTRMMDARKAASAKLHDHFKQLDDPCLCPACGSILEVDIEASIEQTAIAGAPVVVAKPCDECDAHKREIETREALIRMGVPATLVHCRLENWNPKDTIDVGFVASITRFASTRRGFLFLTGSSKGIGKSHLAVGALREIGGGIFTTASRLLRQLRLSYDGKAQNPIPSAQRTKCLVIDELGVSTGGIDEVPMIIEIVTARYEYKRPTIITTNLAQSEMMAMLGERIADRLTEATWGYIELTGKSHRAEAREKYFTAA